MKKERDIRLELIRVIAMLFVIALHLPQKPFMDSQVFSTILMAVLAMCNTWFYMMSGQLNIKKNFEDAKDIIRYYLSRFSTLFIPFFIVAMVYTGVTMYIANETFSLSGYLFSLYNAVMFDLISEHLWFLYPLFGFIISTPILSKAFNNMTNGQLHIIFAMAVAWRVIEIYLCKDIGVAFGFSGWVLTAWMTSYFAGYYVYRCLNEKNERWLYIAGAISFVITVVANLLIPEHYLNGYDLAIATVVCSMASFRLLATKANIKGEIVKKVILFLAKHSFTIYMVHNYILNGISVRYITIESNGLNFLASMTVTLILSLATALIVDNLVFFPIAKAFRKLIDRI